MKQELIFRAILAIAGIWFLMRFIAPLIAHYFMDAMSGRGKKKNNVDMDILVRRQESLLRKGMEDKKAAQAFSKNQKRNKVLDVYQSVYSGNESNHEIKKSDAKNVLALFDELQWGDGKSLKELSKTLEKRIGADYSPSALSKKVKFVFDKELPLIPEKVMNFKQVLEITGLLAIIELLDQQSKLRRGRVLDYLANRSMLMDQDIALGYEAWAFEIMGKPREQYIKKLATFSALEEPCMDFALDKIQLKAVHMAVKSGEDFIEWLKNQIQIYSELMASVKPIPNLGNKLTLEQSCELLGVSPKIPLENLKKIYKKQAKLRHPDTLSSKKIPEDFSDRAKENFVMIKLAYDTIVKNK